MITWLDVQKIPCGTAVEYHPPIRQSNKEPFIVKDVKISRIKVQPPGGTPQTILREKFEEIASRWDVYKDRPIPAEVKAGNRHESYIRGLIHHAMKLSRFQN